MRGTAVEKRKSVATLGRMVRECPICASPELNYDFIIERFPACSCRRCGLMFLNPQPVHEGMASDKATSAGGIYELQSANASRRLEQLLEYAGIQTGRVLIVSDEEFLAAEARRRGLDALSLTTAEIANGGLEHLAHSGFDACLFYCTLQAVNDPLTALILVRSVLSRTGVLMVISPTLDSRTARLFRSRWWEFTARNKYYFSVDTLQNLLLKAGYGDPVVARDESVVSLQYFRQRLATLPPRFAYQTLRFGLAFSPSFLRDRAFRFLHSRSIVIARPKAIKTTPRLSVIVPAFNERPTVSQLLDQLIAKKIEGVDIEIIVVESNSTDGTREQVLRYKDYPNVRILLEDRPRGKGYAVRTGLASATGDIVLFQDADLEYDIGDYEDLIEPLLTYQQNFVIGSRHALKGRVWKIRQFNDSSPLAAFFNFGHVLFLTLFNLIYQQNLKDPFTMFKVFRRDCLYGLSFECNRFDFDFEIVIKLLRKGYRPLELPVNYRARSISEGKKVTMIRDPLTWIRALLKFRNSTIYSNGMRSVG